MGNREEDLEELAPRQQSQVQPRQCLREAEWLTERGWDRRRTSVEWGVVVQSARAETGAGLLVEPSALACAQL